MNDLKDLSVILTGATGGIGGAIVKKFLLTSRYNKPHGIFLLFFPCIWGIYLKKLIYQKKYYYA